MIYIVHGEDSVKSRTLLINQQKKLGIEAKVEIDASDITPSELFSYVSQKDIFGNSQFIVMNTSNKKIANEDKIIEVLMKTPKETTLVIYAEKTLPKRNAFIKKAKDFKARIVENEYIPKGNVFRFTDSLFSKNRIQTYKELENLLNEETDEFRLFSSIMYALRNITYYLYKSEPFENLKPFQQSKIEKQAKNFSIISIKNIYDTLYELEKGVKTGKVDPEIMLVRVIEKILNS